MEAVSLKLLRDPFLCFFKAVFHIHLCGGQQLDSCFLRNQTASIWLEDRETQACRAEPGAGVRSLAGATKPLEGLQLARSCRKSHRLPV